MKTWIFTGICDKSDLLLYMCKILAFGDNRVLLVDGALDAKYKHCIGVMHPKLPIIEFAGFDVATGFQNYSSLRKYLEGRDEKTYDYVIMDVEKSQFLDKNQWDEADAYVWVSGFEVTGLRKSSALLDELRAARIDDPLPPFHRVYVQVIEDLTDEAYIEGYLEESRIEWLGPPVKMPWDELFFALKIKNEHAGRLGIKPLSRQYKRSLTELIRRLSEMEQRHIRRALRQAGRRHA
ncbi:hypothetical protein C7121_24540 [Paenibacillus glucanolyticus]|uniref:Uncharacterized protein n=1 Tax=Paenibacillus glucanolyticus TaxID=59843 RepID=A0A163LP42_9BACL|nr:hypothetical protein [Paenibacillus glucanolyticus]ETT42694.1 hypothetical protein C169_04182 [Paenibacillus sp. FSL R5-808]ANA82203.1 hypothetical protein A3958_20490 [Paenibacillus glucanolyticus]AVV59061.1 hypothetical protein C7121_24540 [Paenibacillus glucanolyticus]KZS48299.1 hypothetical protein AWU65_21370 [Paenibacillus glucanolyticus]MPY16431.1 hypothetical protein [Paenibacillus glucanolyticus]